MNTIKTTNTTGSAAIVTLILATAIAIVVGTFFRYTTNELRMTQRYQIHKKAMSAAEAGLDKAVVELRNLTTDNQLTSISSINTPPTIQGFAFKSPTEYGSQKLFKVEEMGSEEYNTNIEEGRYAGLVGDVRKFKVTVGVTREGSNQGVVLQRQLQLLRIPLFQFGVFYEEDLEIHPGPTMTFAGPVHTNANIYLGANNAAEYLDQLTIRDNVYRYRKNSKSYQSGSVRIADENGVLKSMKVKGDYLEHDDPQWGIESLKRWGGELADSAHGVPYLSLPIPVGNNAYSIIDRSEVDTGNTYDPDLEDDKFENKADIIIYRADDGTLKGKLKDGTDFPLSYEDSDGNAQTIVSTSTFADFREGDGSAKDMNALDLNIKAFNNHPYLDNSKPDNDEGDEIYEYSNKGLVVYTYTDYPEDSRTTTNSSGCIRVQNAEKLINGGFTLASCNPVYIQGDYNTIDKQPSLVAGDAVSVLSNNWDDDDSWSSLGSRSASDTTMNLCMMNGNTETIENGDYNGGLENLPRMLEDWGGKTLSINGSIFCLWKSQKATGKWEYGSPRYKAPARDWEYDGMYRNADNAPPGMPPVYALETLSWSQIGWSEYYNNTN